MKNLKLGQRFIGAFLILALIVAITGAFGIWINNRVSHQVQSMLKSAASQEKLVLLMEVNLKICQVHLLEASRVRSGLDKFQDFAEDYRSKADTFKNYCNILLKGNPKLGIPAASKGSEIEKRTKEVLQSWARFEKTADELLARKEDLLKKKSSNSLTDDRLNQLSGAYLSTATENAKLTVDELLVTVGHLMSQAHEKVETLQKSAYVAFILVTLAAIALAIILGVLMNRNIVGRIKMMADALDQGASGDLTAKIAVNSNDELGRVSNDFNLMVEGLAEMIGKVKRSISELNKVSKNIYDVSQRVISAAELEAKGIMETSSAVSEINASVNGVAHGVDSLSLSAAESSSSILEMAASIEEVALNVETLSQSVEEVSSSIIEMAASIKQIGQGVQTLMEASTTTASSVAQMDSSIRQVEKNATDTVVISEEVRRDAEIGKAAVDATIAGMHEIRRSSRITTEVMETLSERVNDIGTILSVIDEVAEQTNLLALNAAIIAAQAGEHGKGFAVVADEIKELAERTSTSTREITTLIKGVQEETKRAVTTMSQAETRIADGEELSQKSGEALEKIVHGVQRATEQVGEIARATIEQARGSKVIREAMERVSEMVGQIANATREQTNGSELIMTAVERMKGLTGQVRVSAREQSKVGGLIARSTENITGMIQQIKDACDEQAKGSSQIVHAVEDIQDSTNVNLEATKVMDDAVRSLSRQIEILQGEMSGFKVAQEG